MVSLGLRGLLHHVIILTSSSSERLLIRSASSGSKELVRPQTFADFKLGDGRLGNFQVFIFKAGA